MLAGMQTANTHEALAGECALSRSAAAAYLGLSLHTLSSWATRGGGPAFYKCGSRVVYRRADLDAWLESRRRTSTAETPAPSNATAGELAVVRPVTSRRRSAGAQAKGPR